jgi:hypothetical protein
MSSLIDRPESEALLPKPRLPLTLRERPDGDADADHQGATDGQGDHHSLAAVRVSMAFSVF